MNKAQELIKWFDENCDEDTDLWDLENDKLHEAESITDREITGRGRWETYRESIYKLEDDSYVSVSWSEGSTEYQDTQPNISIDEVEPYEKTVIKYRKVK